MQSNCATCLKCVNDHNFPNTAIITCYVNPEYFKLPRDGNEDVPPCQAYDAACKVCGGTGKPQNDDESFCLACYGMGDRRTPDHWRACWPERYKDELEK